MIIVHVNRQHIAKNAKDGGNRPVYTIKQGRKTRYCREWRVEGGTVEGVYNGTQLSCGARAWLVVEGGNLILIDEMSFAEARSKAAG